MVEQLESFDFIYRGKKKPTGLYNSILDGKIWKVRASEFNYDDDETGIANFITRVKRAAKEEKNRYIIYNVMGDNSIVLQMQGEDYIPPLVKAKMEAKKRKESES